MKVLVVDDSRVSCLMIKAIIENTFTDWEVEIALQAEEALSHCKNGMFDYITLDMNMPGRDGLSIAPELKSACPGVKIALLTGNAHERIKEQARKQGLTFIGKPITDQKVISFLSD